MEHSDFSSVAQSCPALCDRMDCSMPGFPVHHQLSELAQTHVHGVGDAIQPSHPLSSPSPPTFNLSHHQSLFHKSVLRIRWPNYWSFSCSIIPSKKPQVKFQGKPCFYLEPNWVEKLICELSSCFSILWSLNKTCAVPVSPSI